MLHARGDELPIGFGLRPSIDRGARILVVDKHHAVTNKNVILDRHAFADKTVRRNLASRPDHRVLLDFDKGSDLGVSAYATAVKIDEIGMRDADRVVQHDFIAD